MKVLADITPIDFGTSPLNEIILPNGIIGFSQYQRAELLYMPDHLPLLWMRLRGPDTIHFIVMEPGNLIADYEPEIFDEDAEQLGISDPSQALVINIVTLRQQNPLDATINLVGPIVMNRRTRIARQLVIANYSSYSAHWPLVEAAPTTPVLATA